MAELRQHFRPEFLNRLDEIVVFHQLGARAAARDRRHPARSASPSAWPSATCKLEVSDDAKDLLGNLGYDPTYGARPLKRVLQRMVENPLAEAILAGQFKPGDTVVVARAGRRRRSSTARPGAGGRTAPRRRSRPPEGSVAAATALLALLPGLARR